MSEPPKEPLSSSRFLDEPGWSKLIRLIRHGQVIPVIGPELITIEDPETGEMGPLQRFLAPRLATRLGVPSRSPFTGLNEVVRSHLLNGGNRSDVYDEIRELLDELDSPPSEALRQLAGMEGFRLFITSGFDSQVARALTEERPGFSPESHTIRFHPSAPVDLPASLDETRLFHILGDYNTYPDFALWEEDHMEFVCGLLESRDTLRHLFHYLKNRTLLLLGAPASDWIVRFLLRAARQERLSDRAGGATGEYFSDRCEILEEPLVFYFDKLVRATRVVDGSPLEFVSELAQRWAQKSGKGSSDDSFLEQMPSTMPKGSVFISYASDDRAAALSIAKSLDEAGIPVWIDKGRLQAGDNYETSLEAAVKFQSSFFISLISEATEADKDRSRYVHKER
ncbi:MAG: toll/interleukin-1 receptor domain-containing protein, partial [Verrucomicrobiota bacterium]